MQSGRRARVSASARVCAALLRGRSRVQPRLSVVVAVLAGALVPRHTCPGCTDACTYVHSCGGSIRARTAWRYPGAGQCTVRGGALATATTRGCPCGDAATRGGMLRTLTWQKPALASPPSCFTGAASWIRTDPPRDRLRRACLPAARSGDRSVAARRSGVCDVQEEKQSMPRLQAPSTRSLSHSPPTPGGLSAPGELGLRASSRLSHPW